MNINAPDWSPLESRDAAGITAVDMVGVAFFLDPAACSNPDYAVRAFQTYVRQIGRHHPLAHVDDEGDMFALPDDPTEVLVRQIVQPMRAGESARMFLADRHQPPYRYYAQYFYESIPLEERKPDERVPIFFRVSREVFARLGPEAIIAFALELSEFLPYSFGYVSPVLTCDDSFRTALPYLRRYPGLDVADLESVAIDIGDRPLGPYWVNILGRNLSQTLGGPEALWPRVPDGVRIESSGQGGFCVILGEAPDIGDVNRQHNLPLYRQLAAVLRPQLQVPEVTYFTREDGFLDRESQVAWHERFLR